MTEPGTTSQELPPPTGPAVLTEQQASWAPPDGAPVPVLSTATARPQIRGGGSRGWLIAVIAIGAGILLLVFVAILSSIAGTANSIREDRFGPGMTLTPAPGDVSATLLSGYDRRGKPVTEDGQEVLAAGVRIDNSANEEQQYYVRVRFADAQGKRLASTQLSPLVGPGQVVNRTVFTAVPRPAGTDVSVRVSAERSDPLTLMP